MLKLAHCIAPPLCNWALEIAAALRIISTEESNVVWELMPLVVEGENHRRSSSGLFEQIITGLSVACRAGPLPADSFSFVFPVLYFAIWNSLNLTNCGFLSFHLIGFSFYCVLRLLRRFCLLPRRLHYMMMCFESFLCTWILYCLFQGLECYQLNYYHSYLLGINDVISPFTLFLWTSVSAVNHL